MGLRTYGETPKQPHTKALNHLLNTDFIHMEENKNIKPKQSKRIPNIPKKPIKIARFITDIYTTK